jgi:uncharacterized membrane protein
MTAAVTNSLDERIIATYPTNDKAKQAKVVLMRKLGLLSGSIKIVEPNEKTPSEKLEGSSKPIGKKMLLLHLKYPAMGFLIGMCIAFLLVLFGPAFAQISPMFTFIALISHGVFIGAFFAGFRSLKPEHDHLNQHALQAKEQDYWSLIVNTNDTDISKQDICDEIEQTECVVVKVSK